MTPLFCSQTDLLLSLSAGTINMIDWSQVVQNPRDSHQSTNMLCVGLMSYKQHRIVEVLDFTKDGS